MTASAFLSKAALTAAAALALALCSTAANLSGILTKSPSPVSLSSSMGGEPLRFEENRGQAGPTVRFLARGSGQTLLLGDTEATLLLRKASRQSTQSGAVRWRLANAEPSRARAERPLPTKVNYLRGADASRWKTRIPTCAQVRSA